MRPTCIDLFCGAGGMSLGFEEAGFNVVAGVEIDPVHANVHSYNFPNCTIYRSDISDLTGRKIIDDCGLIDVVIGGPPCQGFSLIGRRDEHDVRNHLVMEFMRIVSEINPKYFVMENVAGLTVGYGKAYLEEAISFIEKHGFSVVKPYKVLNAADYGVPQNRKRLFLLGYRNGQKAPEYPERLEKRVTVAEAISDLPDIDGFDELLNDDSVSYTYSPCSEYAVKLHDILQDRENYGFPRIWNSNILTGSLRTVHTEESRVRFHATQFGDTEKVSRFYKLDPSKQCNTLRAGTDKSRGAYTSPRPIHPFFDRCISVREAERLHSFPDWFRMHKTKWHGFREVGNSVPPLLAKAVAKQVVEAIGITPTKPTVAIPLGLEAQLSTSVGQAIREEKMASKKGTKYSSIIEAMFLNGYTEGSTSVPFTRENLIDYATHLGIAVPKNIGDIIYSFRYRAALPESIQKTAPEGKEWIIVGTGSANYEFRLCNKSNILPNPHLEAIPIPNNTPEIISMYQLSDEQSLLCKIRYNRILDIFLGIVSYSMQNHLRTQVTGIGQIEIDEIYVGVNKQGQHFIMPVEAKVGSDMVGVVQLMQDIKYCEQNFPDLICIPVAVHKMESENDLCLFRLKLEEDVVKIVDEKHYILLPANEVDRSFVSERNRAFST